MKNLRMAATERTPEIDFDFAGGEFSLRGTSYAENSAQFFQPALDSLAKYLSEPDPAVSFTFELTYVNSASAQLVWRLFDLLDEAAGKGHRVSITWIYDEDDENMEELGTMFAEDLENVKVDFRPTAA